MPRVDPEYLTPPLAACIAEIEVDVGEGLVDLGVDVGVEFAGCGVPAAC